MECRASITEKSCKLRAVLQVFFCTHFTKNKEM
nr:MAG TPA: hypothetical protein [Caudoviricetes sp.]